MTHPATPEVGGEPAPVDTQPNLDDRLSAALMSEDELPQEQDEQPEAPIEGEEPTEALEGEEEIEVEVEAEELPPIDAPISWTGEEKERFASLPRETQEYIAKREADRERFVQSKAQEAAQQRQATIREAAELLAQREAEKAEQLEKYARQFAVQPPDPHLLTVNAHAYAEQLAAYQHYTAQSQMAQREAEQARAQQAQYEEAILAQQREEFAQRIGTELPEFFDETNGPKLKEELTATAKFLGFSDDEIVAATAGQIVALKKISDIKAKAEKYDALMKRQMERVRSGKTPPPIAKPGAPTGPTAQAQSRYQADREAMRRGDKAAEQRVINAILNQ